MLLRLDKNMIFLGSLGGQIYHTINILHPRVHLLSRHIREKTVQIKKIKNTLLVFVNVFILIKYIFAHSLCYIRHNGRFYMDVG